MRRTLALGILTTGLALACSDDIPEPAAQPESVALSIEMTLTQSDARTSTTQWEGWWDASISAAALTEDGEPFWHERDGLVTRTGVMVPDLTTRWTQFDLATWGTIGYTDRDFLELGTVVEIWGVPSVQSLVNIRNLIAAQDLDDGAQTTSISGSSFLAAVDEVIARRSLVDCAGQIEIEATVAEGLITELAVAIDTGAFSRSVSVDFASWEGELPDPPAEGEITRARHHRRDEPAPPRPARECGHGPQTPVGLDRAACPTPGNEFSNLWVGMVERHAESTPDEPTQLWLSLARRFDPDELTQRLTDHDLAATGVNIRAELASGGGMSANGFEVDAVPASQADLDALISDAVDLTFVAGTAVISSIEVTGTWGDIARFASDCDIFDVGHGNGAPVEVDLSVD